MEFSVIFGIALGIVLIVAGIWTGGGQVLSFYDTASVFIVLGGTVAATIVHFGIDEVKRLGTLFRIAVRRPAQPVDGLVATLVELSEVARREGLLAMEDRLEELDDPFLRSAVQLVVDGSDPELVKSILEIEMTFLEERHRKGQNMLQTMASLSPAFGMIGTLIGLVIMLGHLNEPENIGPAMAVALITTFYGSVLANLVFAPVAGRLRQLTEHEILMREIITEGVLSIQQGENPRVVEQKLKSFMAPGDRLRRIRSPRPAAGLQPDAESVVSSGVR